MKLTQKLTVIAVATVCASQLQASWLGFYTPSEKVEESAAVPEQVACVREIFRAQVKYGIPDNLLLGIGLQEAGLRRDSQLTVWPWAVNAEGASAIFDDRATATRWVEARRGEGMRSIDIGCMQINLRWHPEAFLDVSQGFEPETNVDYAARFLLSLYHRFGDWELAAGSYHSLTPERREIYLASLRKNVAVANSRIAEFVTLAALEHPLDQSEDASIPGQGMRPGIVWSAGLSELQEDSNGARSLYSDRALQPVLPVFRKVQR